jgi:site-specific DNA-methyltransferase (adenine-specific)
VVALGGFEGNRVYQGDCLKLLQQLPDNTFDAMATDPPYCSGGDDVTEDPNKKYVQGGTKLVRPTFDGDARSAHAFRYWCALWNAEAYRAAKPGAYGFVFSDAKMLNEARDAFEAGGWIFREIIVWDKTEKSRAPHTGYFRKQCEYVIWGTKGDFRPDGPRHLLGPFAGCYRIKVDLADKHHTTGKPVSLMEALLAPLPRGSLVLDPFAGSGSTIRACVRKGLVGLGFEQSDAYTTIANDLIREEQAKCQT